MADTNLYADLKKALTDFEAFLQPNVATIQAAVRAIKVAVPRISELLTGLITLLAKIRAELVAIDVGAVPGLSQLSTLTSSAKTLLDKAETLLPQDKADIDKVLAAVDVVSSLPSLDTVKADILKLIDDITALLQTVNS